MMDRYSRQKTYVNKKQDQPPQQLNVFKRPI